MRAGAGDVRAVAVLVKPQEMGMGVGRVVGGVVVCLDWSKQQEERTLGVGT
jgi:hypothetical protein